MMLRFIKQKHILQVVALCCLLFLWSCNRVKKKEYAHSYKGYYYKLISFRSDTFNYRPHYFAQLAASFATQADSVFWDSYSNLNDNFFVELDSLAATNYLIHYSSLCAAGDSACLLIPTPVFYSQQFKTTQVPFFSRKDSVVKVRIKLKQVLSPVQFASVNRNLEQKETMQIRNFYGSEAEFEKAKDPAGFYWVLKPKEKPGEPFKTGTKLSLSYSGYYLNGRFLEKSPGKFEFIYGTPEQLLKGLNYVIGKIKIGQNAKIILPSRLAFGENGSTNGSVPPYTPLLYEIKITDVKE